jgi:DNA mismatch repair ATPase MutS
LPPAVLERARKLLALFEGEEIVTALGGPQSLTQRSRASAKTSSIDQFSLFGSTQHPLLDELRKINPERLTPIEALSLLDRLVSQAKQG